MADEHSAPPWGQPQPTERGTPGAHPARPEQPRPQLRTPGAPARQVDGKAHIVTGGGTGNPGGFYAQDGRLLAKIEPTDTPQLLDRIKRVLEHVTGRPVTQR